MIKVLEKGYATIEWDVLVNDTQEAVEVRFVEDHVFLDHKHLYEMEQKRL
jgi:hypothetical protein